jgi:hypothetical protein
MDEVTFTGCQRGSLFAVSPSAALVAFVRGSIQLVIVQADQPLGIADTQSQDDNSKLCNEPPELPSPSFVFKALDAVTGLQWSPDSQMVMLLLQERGVIEIVSAVDRVSVARVDCGLNGLLAAQWHPSSTAVYYFGLCRAQVASLVDGASMTIDFGVKLVPDTAGNMSDLPATQERLSRLSRSAQQHPLPSWAPLLAFTPPLLSTFYTVSPASAVPSVLSPERPPSRSHEEGYSKDFSTSEYLNLFSSTTHESVLRVPLEKLGIRHVSVLHPLQFGVCLGSQLLQAMYVVAGDGSRVMHRIEGPSHRVQTIAVSSRTVAALTEAHCHTFVVAKDGEDLSAHGSIVAMSPIPLAPSLLAKTVTVLSEIGGGGGRESAYASETDSAAWLTSFSDRYLDTVMTPVAASFSSRQASASEARFQQRLVLPCPTYCCAISPNGEIVAVVCAKFPSTVVICDVLFNTVRTVLRHERPVTSLRFIRRVAVSSAYSPPRRRKSGGGRARAQPSSRASGGCELEHDEVSAAYSNASSNMLLIATENNAGVFFVWGEEFASAVTVPRQLYEPVVRHSVQATYGSTQSGSMNSSRSISNSAVLGPKVRHAAAFTAENVGCSLTRLDAVALVSPSPPGAGVSSHTRNIRAVLVDEKRQFAVAASIS